MKDDFLSSSGAWRRDVLLGALAATVAVGLPPPALALAERGKPSLFQLKQRSNDHEHDHHQGRH